MKPIITVFILTSGYCPAYLQLVEKTFGSMAKIVKCHNNQEVNAYPKEHSWYLVLHEGEIFDKNLIHALFSVIMGGHAQYYTCFKRDKYRKKFFIRPYLFRDFVQLNNDDANPLSAKLLRSNRLLDGWVYDV